jgi:hypothetical protein
VKIHLMKVIELMYEKYLLLVKKEISNWKGSSILSL